MFREYWPERPHLTHSNPQHVELAFGEDDCAGSATAAKATSRTGKRRTPVRRFFKKLAGSSRVVRF